MNGFQELFERAKLFLVNDAAAEAALKQWPEDSPIGKKPDSKEAMTESLFLKACELYNQSLEILPIATKKQRDAARESRERARASGMHTRTYDVYMNLGIQRAAFF